MELLFDVFDELDGLLAFGVGVVVEFIVVDEVALLEVVEVEELEEVLVGGGVLDDEERGGGFAEEVAEVVVNFVQLGRKGGTFSWCISRWRSMVLYRYFSSVPSVAILMSMLHSAMAGAILYY